MATEKEKTATATTKEYEDKETKKTYFQKEGEVNCAKCYSAKECSKDRNRTFRFGQMQATRAIDQTYCSDEKELYWSKLKNKEEMKTST